MSVSIRVCPSCNRLLLEDTVQCPDCHHVIDTERAAEAPSAPAKTHEDATSEHDSCPNCGEEVRRGLVRCWNCGTFMRPEIAKFYKQMQATPRKPILSQLPPEEDEGKETVERTSRRIEERDSADDDDTFELGARDEDFVVGADVDVLPDEGDYYELSEIPLSPMDEEPRGDLDELKNEQPEVSKVAAEERTSTPPAEGVAPETSESAAEEGSTGAPEAAETDLPHSVATGGDVLLQVALEEEAEKKRRRTTESARRGGPAMPKTGFLVFCPNGHRIEVQERHRGMTGRCPKCKEPFVVPARAWQDENLAGETAVPGPAVSDAAPAGNGDGVASGAYTRWMTDARLHVVDPAKLKLTPGSLQKDYQHADIGFAASGMLIAVLVKKGGLFSSNDKKKEPTRAAMFQHLEEEKPLEQLPVAEHHALDADQIREIRVVQPVPAGQESLFAGIPVFGSGQIAVRLPKTPSSSGPTFRFLSFPLSGFREFAAALEDMYIIQGLGADAGVPLVDEFTEYTCHYSDEKLRALEHVEFYQSDPAYKLKIIGRRCKECGLTVSEDSRKKERIGGVSGKTIAKATCPKCKKKFGDITLYGIEKGPTTAAEEDAKKGLGEPGAEGAPGEASPETAEA